MEIRKATSDDNKLEIYVTLMRQCYPSVHKYDFNYLKWLYRSNPDGEVIGYDAFEDGQIIAHHACIPSTIKLYGKRVKALLSVNTATHPAFAGKGLFAKLGEMTHQLGAEKKFSCVYGVANANSTQGFIQKLKGQLVQPLDAKIGFGSLNINAPPSITQFKREWTKDSLNWRCSNPHNPVFRKESNHDCKFYTKSISKFIPVYTELHSDVLPSSVSKDHPLSPIRLFIGLVPGNSVYFKRSFSIPNRLKPSPLNFLFKPLNQENIKLNKGTVFFSFLDFDAY